MLQPTQIDEFRNVCGSLDSQFVVIALGRGDTPVQPMLCKVLSGPPLAIIESMIWLESRLAEYFDIVRVKIEADIDNQFQHEDRTSSLQIDIAANDPLSDVPEEIWVASATGRPVQVRTVSIETAVAWKLHGLFERLDGAWVTKSLWDVYVICKSQRLDPEKLKWAIELAFRSRLDPLACLERLLYGDFGQSAKSRERWGEEIGEYTNGEAVALHQVITWIRAYLAPILSVENSQKLLTRSQLLDFRISELRKLNTAEATRKLQALGRKTRVLPTRAYHSIPHLPESRTGTADRHIDPNKARMLTREKLRTTDIVIVQEKLDGSCVCAYRDNDRIIALGRDGDLAADSPNVARQLWSRWVAVNEQRFLVRKEKVDGRYLPENTGEGALWNWTEKSWKP